MVLYNGAHKDAKRFLKTYRNDIITLSAYCRHRFAVELLHFTLLQASVCSLSEGCAFCSNTERERLSPVSNGPSATHYLSTCQSLQM